MPVNGSNSTKYYHRLLLLFLKQNFTQNTDIKEKDYTVYPFYVHKFLDYNNCEHEKTITIIIMYSNFILVQTYKPITKLVKPRQIIYCIRKMTSHFSC